jgi:hypothetical protein
MKQDKTTRKDTTVVVNSPFGKKLPLTAINFSRIPSDLEILVTMPIDSRINENEQFTYRNICIDFSSDGSHNYEVQDYFRKPNKSICFAAIDYALAELDLMKTN